MNVVSLRVFARTLNIVSMLVVAAVAAVVVLYTFACALGFAPWLQLTLNFGGQDYVNAGQFVQIFSAVALVLFASFLPAAWRVTTLEAHHRQFHLKMEDVAQAYYYCHAADRSGVFKMKSEFDAVRERLVYLRDHPDLSMLEADVLEIAAQMSQQAKDLAATYSDEKVGRAKTFLRQRQQEVAQQKERISDAVQDCIEIERWVAEIDMDESMVASQLGQLEERLIAATQKLGLNLGSDGSNVYPIKPRTVAE
ncbi:hypothetical protein [Loktanella sp. S4079]|uniref:hypothetical protein n=1 Tax=Loktanella sp. S4079 TaxID=579483 RepID=UPI0005FA2B56|nr:hypothetical protein [Loktanella sp. S4079]KJZ19940.1 hypothetical protein TW80_03515 [Loktanella sp. S4079]